MTRHRDAILHALRPRSGWALFLILGAALGACDNGTTGPEQEAGPPPDLPAATSMNADFGLLASGSAQAAQAQSLSALVALAEQNAAVAGVGLNFTTAALSVVVAQAITALHLVVPAAVFAAAANNTPSFEDDGRWHWRYTASQGGQLWTAHIAGVVQGDQVTWDMRITAPQTNPPLDEFLWYSGVSRVDRTSGTWRFNDITQPGNPTEVVRVDWSHESDVLHGVTITVTSGPNVGDVLTADRNGDNHLVTWYDASQNEEVEIGWNAATGTGYIIAPHYNGGLRACWDANQNNTTCTG
ncbi:MAG: hypothetical protein R3E10_11830 [Gemmatimonadota bacterium]